MSQPGKVKGQQAFVLHAQPYKETSLLVEMFTREHGRVGLVARGARRPRAGIRALLLPFSPLEVGWFGKSDIRTLSDIDWQGGLFGFYFLPELPTTYHEVMKTDGKVFNKFYHGMLDRVTHRKALRDELVTIIRMLTGQPPAIKGDLPAPTEATKA